MGKHEKECGNLTARILRCMLSKIWHALAFVAMGLAPIVAWEIGMSPERAENVHFLLGSMGPSIPSPHDLLFAIPAVAIGGIVGLIIRHFRL